MDPSPLVSRTNALAKTGTSLVVSSLDWPNCAPRTSPDVSRRLAEAAIGINMIKSRPVVPESGTSIRMLPVALRASASVMPPAVSERNRLPREMARTIPAAETAELTSSASVVVPIVDAGLTVALFAVSVILLPTTSASGSRTASRIEPAAADNVTFPPLLLTKPSHVQPFSFGSSLPGGGD